LKFRYVFGIVLVGLFVSFSILYINLLRGIHLRDIHLKGIDIGTLSIQIQKKFVVYAKDISIRHNVSNGGDIDIINNFKFLKTILQYLSFFQAIHIHNLSINHSKINDFRFAHNRFSINTPQANLHAIILPKDNKLYFKIFSLYYKPKDIVIKDVTGSFYSDLIYLYLNVQKKHIKAFIKASNHKIFYDITCNNATFQNYHINAHIKGNKQKASIYIKVVNNLLSLESNMHLYIRNKLYLKSKHLALTYQDIPFNINDLIAEISQDNIILNARTISSKDVVLNNPKASLSTDKVAVSFHSQSLISSHLNKILRLFHIDNPVYQTQGNNRIIAYLTYHNHQFHPDITLITKNASLQVAKNVLLGINGHIRLKDHKLLFANSQVTFHKSIVHTNYHIHHGTLDFDTLDINASGDVDMNITHILSLHHFPEHFNMDLKKLQINLERLHTNIYLKPLKIVISSFKDIPHPLLKEYQIYNGHADISLMPFLLDADIFTHQNIILLNKKPIPHFHLHMSNNDINITHKQCHIHINYPQLHYRNCDINITRFLTKQTQKTRDFNISIAAKNTNIIYKNVSFYLQQAKLHYNHYLIINAQTNPTTISIKKNNKFLDIIISHLTDKTLTLSQDFLQDFDANIHITRYKDKAFNGYVDINKGYIHQLKGFNNLIAFINLIPSLATFRPAGFTNKGYQIKYAHIDFIYDKPFLYLKGNIKGMNINFDINGYINTDKQTINLNVKANILIKILKDIPIVNYILLGKDKGITINLTVTGNLHNPKIHKNTTKNIIQSPLNIIQRAITIPFHLKDAF